MKKALALLIPVVTLTATLPATAGDDKKHKKKCSAEAEVCIRDMAEGLKKRGWIGIEWETYDPRPVISHVGAGSPAAEAGIEVGDVVVAFAGVSTDEKEEVIWGAMKRALVPGKTITVEVLRDDARRQLKVELVAVPDHIVAQWVGMHVLQHHAAAPEDQVAESP